MPLCFCRMLVAAAAAAAASRLRAAGQHASHADGDN